MKRLIAILLVVGLLFSVLTTDGFAVEVFFAIAKYRKLQSKNTECCNYIFHKVAEL